MRQKLFALLLVVCLCIGMTVTAEAAPTITVGSASAQPGETFTVPITLTDNPGFAAMLLELTYDSKQLTPVSAAPGKIAANTEVITNLNTDESPNPVTLFVVRATNFYGHDSVFEVTFRVNDDAAAGETALSVAYHQGDIANQKLEDLSFALVPGTVTITADAQPPVEDEPVEDEPIEDEPIEDEPVVNVPVVNIPTANIPAVDMPAVEIPKPSFDPNKVIDVTIDGVPVKFDQPPILTNGRTLVPMRAIFEALGATVDWEPDTRTATGVRGDISIRIQIDNNIMKKNDEPITLDVPAQLINSRTLVPVRAISESFNCKVDWIAEQRSVVILTK